jgi:hypothetical protein
MNRRKKGRTRLAFTGTVQNDRSGIDRTKKQRGWSRKETRTDGSESVAPKARIQRSPFRMRRQQAPEMPLGSRVFVLKGDTHNDLGQMATISAIVGSQVEMRHQGPTGMVRTRRKQRSSLIPTEEGVELVMNEEGWLIVQVRRDQLTEEDEEIGAASEDGDVRAQQKGKH